MAQLIKAATPLWNVILVLVGVLGGILLVGGLLLAYSGNAANTTMTLFGNQFTSTSVGVTIAFLGVVLIVVIVQRILKSMDRITGSDAVKKGDEDASRMA